MSDNKKNIFISFKNTDSSGDSTPDAKMAQLLFDHFTNTMNMNCFMMNETLPNIGNSDFKRVIDEALDEATVLIVVASQEEYVESEWVRYEWDTFLNEVLSGRKKGQIFTVLLNHMKVKNLPISLRKYESFFENNLNAMYAFVDKALTNKKAKKKIQFIYPCIFTKKEDDTWIGEYPDLNIQTEGKDIDEVYTYANDLLRAYFDYAVKYEIDVNSPNKLEKYLPKLKENQLGMLMNCIIEFD